MKYYCATPAGENWLCNNSSDFLTLGNWALREALTNEVINETAQAEFPGWEISVCRALELGWLRDATREEAVIYSLRRKLL